MRFLLLLTFVLAVSLTAPPRGAAAAVGPYPHLAGTLPPQEDAILQALRQAGLTDRLIHIAADTNGHLSVASLVFMYRTQGDGAVAEMQSYAWDLLQATFGAAPAVDEVDLSAFHQGDGLFDANRRDVTFSAAVSREEFARIPAGVRGMPALALLPRLWYHPLLQGAGKEELQRHTAQIPHLRAQREGAASFSGSLRDWATEFGHRIVGHVTGGVIDGKLYRGSLFSRNLALTFDDGPTPIYTTLLLDTLDRLHLRATFFLIGARVQQYPYFAQAIVRKGHELGNHSFHHVNLTRVSPAQLADELARTQQVIAEVTGTTPRYFRPPGGDYTPAVLKAAQVLGLITVFWTDDPGDYAGPGPRALELKLLARVSNGGILLLHQGVGVTLRILPQVTEILQRRGFTITTASGLIAGRRSGAVCCAAGLEPNRSAPR